MFFEHLYRRIWGGLNNVPHAPHVGTLCSPLTTRFSRSVELVAMGAMLPPIPLLFFSFSPAIKHAVS